MASSKVKPLTVVCANSAAAKWLADEYTYIGRRTVVDGRYVTVLTR